MQNICVARAHSIVFYLKIRIECHQNEYKRINIFIKTERQKVAYCRSQGKQKREKCSKAEGIRDDDFSALKE